jgi:hypothetical protein
MPGHVYPAFVRSFPEKRYDGSHQEKDKANLCDERRRAFELAKSEKTGHEGDDEKNNSITKHGVND